MASRRKSQTNEYDADIIMYKQKGGILATVVIKVAKYGFPSLGGYLSIDHILKAILG